MSTGDGKRARKYELNDAISDSLKITGMGRVEAIRRKRPGNEHIMDTIKRWNIELYRGNVIIDSNDNEQYISIGGEAVKEIARKIENRVKQLEQDNEI